jgi:meso-butanediol dehydrogenase/(S,S)-butanediol dehydrogenase/diacetyl reductase
LACSARESSGEPLALQHFNKGIAMPKLLGKIALITGSGSGMGQATSQLFAKGGAKVAVVDWNEAGTKATVEKIRKDGNEAIAIHADVSKEADAERMVAETIKKWGKLDIIYNNAGIAPFAMIHETSPEDWDQVLNVNLRGVFLGCHYALPQLMKHGGVVLSTASVAGLEGLTQHGAYCASKAGVIALTKVIAMDYARYKIRANCILPSSIDTPLFRSTRTENKIIDEWINTTHPMTVHRLGTAEDIANAALYLCSDEAFYVTGQALAVDGGYTAGHAAPISE